MEMTKFILILLLEHCQGYLKDGRPTISYKNICQDHYRWFETTNNPLKSPPTNQCWEWDFGNWCNIDATLFRSGGEGWGGDARGGGDDGQQS